jgi:SAM-dependent methyltransferase
MKESWDERYSTSEYIYGVTPNMFFKKFIDYNQPGRILIPADGEGRNSVYAAQKGWEVTAFDYSSKAREKALNLAKINNVIIDYHLMDFAEYKPDGELFDFIALIFVHIPVENRAEYHHKIINSLKSGGLICLEAFTKEQINYTSGGPKILDLLYSKELLLEDFKELEILLLEERSIIISEGNLHEGEAKVIDLIARKK